ncbi:MAG: response regulator [Candidatus Aminicenantes bacterium]|nr:response regulator [Candidatus Aminicenantes bacterium]
MTPNENRLLIVDPDPRVRQALTETLSRAGRGLDTACNLAEAIKKIPGGGFSCLVMDVDLPEMKGYEAVPVLKNLDPGLKIIMTTRRNSKKLEARVRREDIFYYFIKPFGTEELRLAVDSAFNKKKEEEAMSDDPKILVIDDDPDFRAAVTPILKSALYEVVTASSLEEGKKTILAEKPDLILLDIMMDSLFDGFSLCNDIKTSPEFREVRGTPVIFCSAVKDMAGSRFQFPGDEEGLAGPDDYIDKPVKPKDLLARIQKLLKK